MMNKLDLLSLIFCVSLIKSLLENMPEQGDKYLSVSKKDLKFIRVVYEKMELARELELVKGTKEGNRSSEKERYNAVESLGGFGVMVLHELGDGRGVDGEVRKAVKAVLKGRFVRKAKRVVPRIVALGSESKVVVNVKEKVDSAIKKMRPKRLRMLRIAEDHFNKEFDNKTRYSESVDNSVS